MRTISIAIRMLVVVLFVQPAWAFVSSALQENFDHVPDGKLPRGWAADEGDWQVVDGKLRGAPSEGRSQATLFIEQVNGSIHVALEADVILKSATDYRKWIGLIVRAGDQEPGALLKVRKDTQRSNGMEISAKQFVDPRRERVLQIAGAPGRLGDGKTHHLRIETNGHWIRGYFDGQKILHTPRADEVSRRGRFGFRVNGAVALFDNIKIWDLDAYGESIRWPGIQPLVIAHRGASANAPENTLAAYRLAIEAGAEMAECDVRLSADRKVVLLHDENLQRTTGLDAKVGDLTLAELKKLDAGRWKSTKYAGEPIPTLEEALDLVKGKQCLVIEIKERGMEKEVVEVLRDGQVRPGEVMIFSFHYSVVKKIAELEPTLPTTWLLDNLSYRAEDRQKVIREALKARISALGLQKERFDPDFARLAHQAGFQIFVWTVNDPVDMHYLIRIGADGIITNYPDMLLHLLNRRGAKNVEN